MSGTNPPSRFSPEGAASNEPASPTSPPSLSSSAYPGAPSYDRAAPAAPGTPNPGDQRPTKMPTAAWVAIAVLAALAALAGTLYITKDSSTAADPAPSPAPAPTTQPGVPQAQTVPAPTTPPESVDTAPASETAAPTDTAPPADTAAPADTPTTDAPSPTPATPNPGPTPTPISATGEGWIPSGTYKFPEEIGPGRYRVARSYAVMDTEGDEVFTRYATNEGMVVMILPEGTPPRTIDIEGGAWPLETVGPVDPTQYHDGVYLVGYDIQPGTYRVSPVPNFSSGIAYLGRLDKNLELIETSLVELSETDNPSVTLVIEPGDYAIEFTGAIEKVD